ncbi:MAG: hypothetical protein HC841_02030 [Verrucomicrobiae bacterium]|nr:hypothetical protein [Verrucomicrobiae bacterium]
MVPIRLKTASCIECHRVKLQAGPHFVLSRPPTRGDSTHDTQVEQVFRFKKGQVYPVTIGGAVTELGSTNALYTALVEPGTNGVPPGYILEDPDEILGYERPAFGVANKEATLIVPDLRLAVDANRDGSVTFDPADRTTAAKPFRFWVNEDTDLPSGGNPETVGGTPDGTDNTINSPRDLEDFTRLRLKVRVPGRMDSLRFGPLTVEMRFAEATGAPALRVFRAADNAEGTGFLYDPHAASLQLSFAGTAIGGAGVSPMALSPAEFQGLGDDDEVVLNLLVEGVSAGRGKLLVALKQGGAVLAESPGVWIELLPVVQMYQEAGVPFTVPPDEQPHSITFVHGWHMSPDGSRNYAETMFKRLWHRGFRGRFLYFRWDTGFSSTFNNVPLVGEAVSAYLANFNGSERIAWNSGRQLREAMNEIPSSYSRNLAAHSMGNIVAGAALLAGLNVDNYVLMQGAVPASCYDPSEERRQAPYPRDYAGISIDLFDKPTPDDDPVPETRALAYRGRLSSAQIEQANLVNFFLPGDAATVRAWEFNNDQFKPAGQYAYSRGAPVGDGGIQRGLWWNNGMARFDTFRSLTDPYEAMPLACKSWSKTVGGDRETDGTIDSSEDLESIQYSLPGDVLGFRDDHSAQFKRNIQVLKPFYDELLRVFEVPRITQ